MLSISEMVEVIGALTADESTGAIDRDQPPGAAPRSTTLMPGRISLYFSWTFKFVTHVSGSHPSGPASHTVINMSFQPTKDLSWNAPLNLDN